MKQSEIMMDGAADDWFDRNRERLGAYDPVTPLLDGYNINPTNALEVGCANGWRLAKLQQSRVCNVWGVDASRDAILAAPYRIPMMQATADDLPFGDGEFDLLIYGFCLYLADPDDWLWIAAEGDRVLRPGGFLVVHDFNEQLGVYARKYAHHSDVWAWHFDFAKLWLANPFYSMVTRQAGAQDDTVTILKKGYVSDAKVLP